MSRARIERNCPLDPALQIQRAVGYLTSVGYQSEGAAYGEAQLVYARGSLLSVGLDEHRHTLRILREGSNLIFEFSTGLGSSGMVIESERRALEDRVDAAMRTVPGKQAKIGCRFCGQITATDAAACEQCGSADFR